MRYEIDDNNNFAVTIFDDSGDVIFELPEWKNGIKFSDRADAEQWAKNYTAGDPDLLEPIIEEAPVA